MLNSYKIRGFRSIGACCILLILFTTIQKVYTQVPDRAYASKNKEASRLLELAKTAIDQGQFPNALDILNRTLQYDTDHIEAYFTRAYVKEQLDDPNGALTDYQIVLLLDSTFKEAAFNRAKLRYKQNQYQRAVLDFKKVLTMSSSGTQAIYFKGTPLNNDGVVAMEQITTSYHLDADIYNYLGLCYQALGEIEEAIQSWNQALHLNPNDANYYVNRGLCYSASDSGSLAIADFKSALVLDPAHPIAQFNLTRQMETNGQLDIATYNELINNNPEFASAYVNRALAKLNSGDLDGAVNDYQQAIKIDSQDPTLYLNRALALVKQQQWRKALQDLNKALQLDPMNPKALRSRGRVLFQLEEYQLALEDMNESIRLEPQFGGGYFNRALVLQKTGDLKNSCKDLETAKTYGVESASKALIQYCSDIQ